MVRKEQGVKTYSNGDESEFMNGIEEGFGVYKWVDGRKY